MATDKRYCIEVSAQAFYVEEQSDLRTDRYVFGYHIEISNAGELPARLISRHWFITDATGQVQEVRGMSVVGEHPHLQPGESFDYNSGAILTTPWGTMHGKYLMESDDGTRFEATIPEFALSAPRILH